MARRAIYEFGADLFDMQTYGLNPGGDAIANWFTDVNGAYHPFHQELKEIRKDPIFKHPKVHDWTNGADSPGGDLPPKIICKNILGTRQIETDVVRNILQDDSLIVDLTRFDSKGGGILLLGSGLIAQVLSEKFNEKSIKVAGILDFFKCGHFKNIPIYHPKDTPENLRNLNIICTDPMAYKNTGDNLRKVWNYTGEYINLNQAFPFINDDDVKQKSDEMYDKWMIRIRNYW